ncbi:class I SAM-dependent methyltransferase [Rhodococcus sp. SJ-3]|uniref:class I SAM-dependent methyltransferase n=1 Tax=Rhodococcus sp. SJ-3 TaxID=3454628 RepID=UPI003F7A79C8
MHADTSPAQFWENRYTDSDGLWSGNANASLVDAVSGLAPGTALDLGCGEGADTIWLARGGWDATGVDISRTAVRRATDAARAAGLPVDRIRFAAADLATWREDSSYDLVAASFLHSPVEFPRTDVLRHAAGLVAPRGHLVIVSHAAFPPWAGADAHEGHGDHRFPSPQEEVEALDLEPGSWEVRIAETRARDAIGPDGTQVVLDDTVVVLRRL